MIEDSSTNVRGYFQLPMLTPVPVKLVYKTIVQLQNEVHANGKSVPSSLGRGAQGHLGLVTSAATYTYITLNAVFNRPAKPGPPVQVPNATQFQKVEEVCLHKVNIGQFNLFNLVELTIIHQINTALDSECLADLIYNETGLLTGTIPEILTSLFEKYGDITAQTLAAKNTQAKKFPAITPNHFQPYSMPSMSIEPFPKLQATPPPHPKSSISA